MDSSNVPTEEDGRSPTLSTPPLRRRLSMEEDYFYQEIMTSPPRPSQPPPYKLDPPVSYVSRRKDGKGKGKGRQVATSGGGDDSYPIVKDEVLPGYSSSISLEGIFSKKHEIENTIKRAEDRQWHSAYLTLTGTALNIHRAKKNWGWGRTRDDGPSVDPDNPPWMGKGAHEKTYSLLYADVGIAADYKKRRYVIRVRAETDQFLISCVELSTFVKWLEGLFAAIDVAPSIDDRDFPRDMSIPRIQRVRWFRGQPPLQTTIDMSEVHRIGEMAAPERRASASSTVQPDPQTRVEVEYDMVEEEDSPISPPRIDPIHRLSTTSYPNLAIDPGSGKWFPEHQWSSAHDMLYAKLCYSNLLFRSPRKSNYIISKGKQWFVDWQSGRMIRVLPPAYGEIEWFGPWQVIHTENRRI